MALMINLKKHKTSDVLKTRGLEMEYLKEQWSHHITLLQATL
jgi:hypothetical protein